MPQEEFCDLYSEPADGSGIPARLVKIEDFEYLNPVNTRGFHRHVRDAACNQRRRPRRVG
jgi:hypothetical protein